MHKLIVVFLLVVFVACSRPDYKNPHVLIETSMGDIEVELYPDQAPKTVAAFLSHIESGVYDKTSFYRVLKAEDLPTDNNTGIIQGGVYQRAPSKNTDIAGINHESTKQSGLSHTDGTISMARTDTGSAKTEFFICIGDQSPLDFGRRGTPDGQGYAAFGKVVKGMGIVRKIQSEANEGDRFKTPIDIREIERL